LTAVSRLSCVPSLQKETIMRLTGELPADSQLPTTDAGATAERPSEIGMGVTGGTALATSTGLSLTTAEADHIRRMAASIRWRVLDIAERQNGGYLSQACSSAEILATLYGALMHLGAAEPVALTLPDAQARQRAGWGGSANGSDASGGDRFLLSPAHYASALYAILVETGRLPEAALDTFGRDGGTLEMIGAEYSPGFETTSGSLGQALSVAIGRAAARKRRRQAGTIWALLSDGELDEGQTWEAVRVAPKLELGNLAVLMDVNLQQVDGRIETTGEAIASKVAAFGWQAVEVDGHAPVAITAAVAGWHRRAPLFVACRTSPTHGIPSLARRSDEKLHFVRFRPGEAEECRRDLRAGDNAAVRTHGAER